MPDAAYSAVAWFELNSPMPALPVAIALWPSAFPCSSTIWAGDPMAPAFCAFTM